MAKGAKKASKKRRGRRVKAGPAEATAGSNTIDRAQQNLARVHRDAYIKAKASQNRANRAMAALTKTIKSDGLSVRQIKLMAQLATPEGEAAFKASVAADLLAAQWQGAQIGTQLLLFLEPDRIPAADMAYEEGVQDAMDHRAARPKYAPSVPQHARYMEGYHEEQARQIKRGIKKKPAPKEDQAERAATMQAAREPEPGPVPEVTH